MHQIKRQVHSQYLSSKFVQCFVRKKVCIKTNLYRLYQLFGQTYSGLSQINLLSFQCLLQNGYLYFEWFRISWEIFLAPYCSLQPYLFKWNVPKVQSCELPKTLQVEGHSIFTSSVMVSKCEDDSLIWHTKITLECLLNSLHSLRPQKFT